MGKPHQVGVGAGGVDNDEIVGALDRTDRFGERAKLLGLDFVEPQAEPACDAIVNRKIELDAGTRRPVAAVRAAAGCSCRGVD